MPRQAKASPTYVSFREMVQRCTNPNRPNFGFYGGRGIRVCNRWRIGEDGKSGYRCFLEDVGQRPDGTWLDRIDNDGNYEPGNCRWATPAEQAQNRRQRVRTTPKNPWWATRLQFRGERMTVRQWAERLGVTSNALRNRLDRGWGLERALTTPNLRAA